MGGQRADDDDDDVAKNDSPCRHIDSFMTIIAITMMRQANDQSQHQERDAAGAAVTSPSNTTERLSEAMPVYTHYCHHLILYAWPFQPAEKC